MAYTAEINRKNPTCIVFLLDQSGSMSGAFGRADAAGLSKAQGLADAFNRMMYNLVLKCARDEEVRDYCDVGVIGYSGQNSGSVKPALGGSLARRCLVPISEIANNPIRVETRKKKEKNEEGQIVEVEFKLPIYLKPVASSNTPMCRAFREVRPILEDWVTKHPKSFPPIVFNITDGQPTDGNPEPEAEAVKNQATDDGNILVFNCHISSQPGTPIFLADKKDNLPDDHAKMLFRMSSVLPKPFIDACKEAQIPAVTELSRGFAFNADLVQLIEFLDIGTRGVTGRFGDR